MDPYSYVGDNPETWTDPTGQFFCAFDFGCGATYSPPLPEPKPVVEPKLPLPWWNPPIDWYPPLPPYHGPGAGEKPPVAEPKHSGETGLPRGWENGPGWIPPQLPDKPYAANDDDKKKDPEQKEPEKKNPEAKQADDRAKELIQETNKFAQIFTTVGVAHMVDEDGNAIVAVAINEGGLSHKGDIENGMNPEEVLANGPDTGQKKHAEEILVEYAKKHHLTIIGIGASRDFCGPDKHDCQGMLLQEVGEQAMGQ
jgi:hypothetical protein